MRFGAMNFPVRKLDDEIREIASLGFHFLELAMDPPACHAEALRPRTAHVRRQLADHGLDVICHLPTFVSAADLTPGIRDASLQETATALEVAAELGARRVVLHPAFFVGLGAYVPEQSRGFALEGLRHIAGKAARLGLEVCLENMFPRGGWLITAQDFAPIMEAFPDLQVTLDTGHAHINGGTERALEFIRTYPKRIRHIHASDNWGKGDDHLPIGAGTVNFRAIVQELKRVSYEDWITFEIFSPDRDYLRISREKLVALWDAISSGP